MAVCSSTWTKEWDWTQMIFMQAKSIIWSEFVLWVTICYNYIHILLTTLGLSKNQFGI